MLKKNWLVYILKCADSSLYTGITNDLPRRLKQHNDGQASRYTRAHGPVELTYREKASSRSEALKREAEIKKFSRTKKLCLINNYKDNK